MLKRYFTRVLGLGCAAALNWRAGNAIAFQISSWPNSRRKR
jgi:hypothetical protein